MTGVPQQEGRTSVDPLVRSLLNDASLSPDWAESFESVPRRAFLPDEFWAFDMEQGKSVHVCRDDEPDAWERYAEAANVPLITQWDDGAHTGREPGRVPTSSSSEPRVVASYLRDAEITPPMRALLIGTGTGWDTGLLSHRLGGDSVVSVEVDAAVAASARTRLAGLGLHPTVVYGDGSLGCSAGAPYDRVIVTAGVRQVARAWVEQTRAGGLILCPWGTHYDNGDALLRLTVGVDGSASGPFLRMVEFMKLRDQRLDWGRFGGHVQGFPGDAAVSSTALTPSDLGERWTSARFVTGLAVPDCAHVYNRAHGHTRVWFFGLSDRSWACAEFRPGEVSGTVHQSGARRLWDQVERALRWWTDQDHPPLDCFGLTVTPDGSQRPWVGDAGHPIPAFG
jgi:protein-L-isoaspartate O-methyltransferase